VRGILLAFPKSCPEKDFFFVAAFFFVPVSKKKAPWEQNEHKKTAVPITRDG
jgi:hypothetical protein